MLHLSSIHYYACYYALLCLLYQQQQALSVTIIIDGATTNEWATRDEYQRLVDNAPLAAERVAGQLVGSDGSPLSGRPDAAAATLRGETGAGRGGGLSEQSILRSINGVPPVNRIVVGEPVEDEPNSVEDASFDPAAAGKAQASAGINLNELEGALDRLEVIERERMEQMKQLNRLKSLEKAAEGSVVNALAGSRPPPPAAGQSQKLSPISVARQRTEGARTISDLVPTSDDDFDDSNKHLVERETAKRYCGKMLVDLLEMVCKSRFYAGESEPQVVNPIIKTKRSVDYAEALAAETNGATRRRKLRNLQQPDGAGGDGDGDANGPLTHHQINNYKENRINDGSNNHNQQYLSSSSSSSTGSARSGARGTGSASDSGNNNNNNKNNYPSSKSKHSRASRFRMIRGASGICCARPCIMEELAPFCERPS